MFRRSKLRYNWIFSAGYRVYVGHSPTHASPRARGGPPSGLVRPIVPAERGCWDALIRARHYLGLQALVGRSLRRVAVVEGAWLALLGWQAIALKGIVSGILAWKPASLRS